MPIVDHSSINDCDEVDCRIQGYLVEHALRVEDSRPVTPISSQVIERIACEAGVDSDFVERRLRTICEQIGSKEGVPTFQMRDPK